MDLDEALCGPLCQHPSCWSTNQRLMRGVPRSLPHHKPRPPSPQNDGLPTQKIVNLLSAYGPDPEDRYPSVGGPRGGSGHGAQRRKYQTQRATDEHQHSKSFPHLTTPNGSPASFFNASSGQLSSGNAAPPPSNTGADTNTQPPQPPALHKVEVQQVFELGDVRRDKTNKAGGSPPKYYVWVPNAKAKSRRKKEATSKSLPEGQLEDSSVGVMPRDVTEIMLPPEVEWKRAQTKVLSSMSEIYEQKQQHNKAWDAFPVTKKRLKSPKAPHHSIPYSRPYSCKSPGESYYGIYELLDLPKDVLLKVLEHIDRRDLLDRDRLAEALTRALPRLEPENSSLAMAYGDVLTQRRLLLREMSTRTAHTANTTSVAPREIQLPPDLTPARDSRHQVSMVTMTTPPALTNLTVPGSIKSSPAPVTADVAEVLSPRKDTEEMIVMATKSPLPSIPSMAQDAPSPSRPKAASISLGLPTLPSGVRITKPFNYKNQKFDLALGPVPSPSPPPPATSPAPPNQSAASPQPSSEHTSIHVTMPTIGSDTALGQQQAAEQTQSEAQPAVLEHQQRKETSLTPDSGSVSLETPDTPLHNVSPALSTHVPKTPAVTPATRALSTEAPDGSTPYARPPGLTPGATGILDTIQENESDNQPEPAMIRSKSDLPKSRRSVRFEVPAPPPPQPPSSPSHSEHYKSPYGPESVHNNYTATNADILTVHDDSMSREMSSRGAKSFHDTTQEPWPEVDEEAYQGTVSPSETPILPASALSASRESTFHSVKKQLMATESPGPPPPSPEPKDLRRRMTADGSSNTKLADNCSVDDVADTDSVITISAKPPSNLDDQSRIQTPATPKLYELRSKTSEPKQPFLPAIFSEEANLQDTQDQDGLVVVNKDSSADMLNLESEEQKTEENKADLTKSDPESSEPVDQDPSPTDLGIAQPEESLNNVSEDQPKDTKVEPEPSEPKESMLDENHDNSSEPVRESSLAQPQTPAYSQTGEVHEENSELVQKLDALDQFSTSEDALREELREELDKLSVAQQAPEKASVEQAATSDTTACQTDNV